MHVDDAHSLRLSNTIQRVHNTKSQATQEVSSLGSALHRYAKANMDVSGVAQNVNGQHACTGW